MNRPHQRIGAICTAYIGAEFENAALEYFRRKGIILIPRFRLAIGFNLKREHHFDLGSSNPPILVECKSHQWAEGGKVPNEELEAWHETMFYFRLAPRGFRKILFVLHDKRPGTGESLVAYYRRIYVHSIPEEVEFLEFDEARGDVLADGVIHRNATTPILLAPERVTAEEIIEFVRSHGHMRLWTLSRRRPFMVGVVNRELVFLPCTGNPRRDGHSITRFCEEFSRANSRSVGDYSDISRNASYTIPIIDAYLRAKRRAASTAIHFPNSEKLKN